MRKSSLLFSLILLFFILEISLVISSNEKIENEKYDYKNYSNIINFVEMRIDRIKFSMVTIEPDYFDIDIKTAKSLSGKSLAPLYKVFEQEERKGAVAAIGGSYFDITYKNGEAIIEPLGLIVEDNKEMFNLVDKRNMSCSDINVCKGYPDQIFYIEEGKPKIKGVTDFKEIYEKELNVSSALQGGDLISYGKSIIPDNCSNQPLHCDKKAARSVICIDRDRKIKLITAKQLDLRELGEKLLGEPFYCYDAVNLDGGGSTSLEYDFAGTKKSIQYKRFFELKRRAIFSYIFVYKKQDDYSDENKETSSKSYIRSLIDKIKKIL